MGCCIIISDNAYIHVEKYIFFSNKNLILKWEQFSQMSMWIIDHTHTGYNIAAKHGSSLLKTRKG